MIQSFRDQATADIFNGRRLSLSVMIRIPSHRPPTHPGEVLLEDFIAPMGLTQRQLAEAIHVWGSVPHMFPTTLRKPVRSCNLGPFLGHLLKTKNALKSAHTAFFRAF